MHFKRNNMIWKFLYVKLLNINFCFVFQNVKDKKDKLNIYKSEKSNQLFSEISFEFHYFRLKLNLINV